MINKDQIPIDEPSMSERELDVIVRDMAQIRGVHRYHTHDSRRSAAGWPDLVLWRDHLAVVELKSADGRLSHAQEDTLASLAEVRCPVCAQPPIRVDVWRPADLAAGRIDQVLRSLRRRP